MDNQTQSQQGADGKNSSQVNKSESMPVLKPFNMKQYITEQMHKDVEDFKESGNLKSGYKNLDLITNLYPGLYVIGAISSLGKTTFMHQMADQIAEAGTPVIYFSLEQNILELASKSLSRIQAKKDASNAMTSLQIRKNDTDPRVVAAREDYIKFCGKLLAVECSFASCITDVEEYIKFVIKKTGQKPVVMVDYLQILQPAPEFDGTTKDEVDSCVRRLKQIQSDYKLVMMVISSFNRASYLTPISYECFKETGGIEYTADVMWGLQLQLLDEPDFDEEKSITKKRLKVEEAKKATPRKIELKCIKNRFGVPSYSCKFDYYSAYEYFVPDMSDLDELAVEAAANKDPDGFTTIPEGLESVILPDAFID